MEKVTGLVRRGSTYSLRRRVPSDLVEALGRKEIWIALGTSDYKIAAKEARLAAVRLDLQWEKNREIAKSGGPSNLDQIVSEADLRRAVLGMFWDQEQKRSVLVDQETRDSIEHDLGALEARDPSAEATILHQAKSIITEKKLPIALPASRRLGDATQPFTASEELVRLLELVRRAGIEQLKRLLDRMDGSHGDTAHDPLFTGINSFSAVPVTSEGVSLGEAIRRMQNDPTRAHLGDTADAKYIITFRALKEVIGAERALASVTRAECAAVQELIAGIPANASKLKVYADCESLKDIAVRAVDRNDKMMAVTTVRVYTYTMSAFFKWAIRKGLLTINPAAELAPAKVPADVSKRPFSIEEMNKIVAGLADWSKGGKLGGRYWVPLIAIFSGMRLGEIVGLTVNDIAIHDGAQCFSLRKSEDMSLKTPGSERNVPIHPELVRLGLLQRVATIRDSGGSRLFPDLQGGTQDQLSDLFQKRFAYWQKQVLGINQKGVSFHSFRHGFRDALREAGVPIDATRALGGWARSGGIEERYGQGTRPSTLARWMAEVNYSGLASPDPI